VGPVLADGGGLVGPMPACRTWADGGTRLWAWVSSRRLLAPVMIERAVFVDGVLCTARANDALWAARRK
jgi:hypothetical protein